MKKNARLLVHRFPIEDDVYARAITLLFGTTEQINGYLRTHTQEGHTPLHDAVVGHWRAYLHDGHEADFICIVRRAGRVYAPVLAHEIAHLIFHAFRRARLPVTKKSEEAFCYYQQWLLRRCLEVMG